jgi:hypothetical protein
VLHLNQHACAALTKQEWLAVQLAADKRGRARRAPLVACSDDLDKMRNRRGLLVRTAVPACEPVSFAVDMQRSSTVRAVGHDKSIGDDRLDLECDDP